MVTRAGGYYGEPFHGKRGLTQGDPLLPTIFNVVVDAVLCHWESLMAEGAGRYNSRVGLKKNVWETVGMACHPYLAARVRADKAYNR